MISDIFLTIITMVFALMVVFSKRTVVSAFALLMTLLSIAMIYFQLGTVFLAAIQVLVNAGAVAILFVFVMMLINLEQFQNNREKGKVKLVISALTILLIMGVFSLIINNNIEVLTVVNISDNSMKLLFDKLFTVYYLPFEMATVLLLAALVACIVITGHEKAAKKELQGDSHE
ncbi:MAG: NADH-quinone oxidoreductase subunit J [Bdellovibrionales bacterium]|nr:NADH-quinone oxidoreductase subunit J [Bdellovibrionales bacterium]